MSLTHRFWLIAAVCATWLLAPNAARLDEHDLFEPPMNIVAAQDLRQDARQSQARGVPILIEFAASDCSYCERLEREVLNPMLISGEYTNRVMIRQVMLDGLEDFYDFDGRAVAGADLARRYGVDFTPTLLFVDHRGRELAKRMVGLTTVDFFAFYLDNRLDQARARLGPG